MTKYITAGDNNDRRLSDGFGRQIDYLRLSVTDCCNLRCTYCMPNGILGKASRSEIMTWEEIVRTVGIFADMGIKKVRLTGGEPFVRKGFMGFLPDICSVKGLDGVYITTNGVDIAHLAQDLKNAGVKGINLSIDALEPLIYKAITGSDKLGSVYDTIHTFIDYDIPLKINTVVCPDQNQSQLARIANLAQMLPIDIRFIEQMPFDGSSRQFSSVTTASMIYNLLLSQFGSDLVFLSREANADLYQIQGFNGRIGIIAAYSRAFCTGCNRIRITSKGIMKNCLYGGEVLDIKQLLRKGCSDDSIKEQIIIAVSAKHADGFESFANKNNAYYECMSSIGG